MCVQLIDLEAADRAAINTDCCLKVMKYARFKAFKNKM